MILATSKEPMNILFLSRWYPDPPDNGSKMRIFNILRALCERHSVTLLSFFNPGENLPAVNYPSPAPKEIHVCSYQEFNPLSRRALQGYLSCTPRYLVDTYRPEMEALIRWAIQKNRFDLIIASQLSMASYFKYFQGIPAIFEEAELGIYYPDEVQGGLLWNRMKRKLTWAKHRRFMEQVLQNFKLCTVASEVECKLLSEAAPFYRPVHVVPNSIDVDGSCSRSTVKIPGALIFTGSLRFAPNFQAMTWFLRDIYPKIRSELPSVRLTITGSPGSRPLPPAVDVVQTGRIPDVRPVVAAASVSVAPILTGGGTRLKIVEAMAVRTPVVATTKAAEGLEVRDGEHLLIADTNEDFARLVLKLLHEPLYAQAVAENAFRLVQARYNWKVVLPHFMQLIDQTAYS